MNEPSVVVSRSWLFTHDVNRPARKKGSLFFPGAYIRWQIRRRLQIAAGDIVYIVSTLDGGLVGWALVREGTGQHTPETSLAGVHLQMLGHASKAITVAGIYKWLDESISEQGEVEIAEQDAAGLDRVLSGVGVPTPSSHPEVVKFRAELAVRTRRTAGEDRPAAQQIREGNPSAELHGSAHVDTEPDILPNIGPLAAVEAKWARIEDLIQLKLPNGEGYFSKRVRTALEVARNISSARISVEKYRIVDGEAVLTALLALGKPGDTQQFGAGTSVKAVYDWLENRVSGIASMIPDPPTEPYLGPTTSAVATPSVTSSLAEAARFARRTGADQSMREKVHLRHMVVALLLSSDGRWALLNRGLVTGEPRHFFRELGLLLSRHVARAHENSDDLGAWLSILGRFNELDLPQTPQPRAVTIHHTAYAADLPGRLADDALDVAKDARAMAELICLDEAQPPLAIGLFGDWGSGKSTFMEMLQEAIDELTARAAKQAALPFVDRIAHIRFNAWHYMDANLWASLVTHIFKELDRQSRDVDNDRDWLRHDQFEWLMKKLGVVQAAEREARSKLDQVNNQIEATKRQLTKIDNERAEAKKKLINASLREALDKQEFGGPDTPIGNAAEAIGLGRGPFTGRQLRELVSEPGSLLAQAKLLARAVGMGSYKYHWPLWLLLGSILAPIAAAIVVAIEFPQLQQLAASIGGVLGPIAGGATWAVSFGIHLKKRLGPLLSQQQDLIREYEKQDAEQAKQEAAAKAELEDLLAQQQQKERELQDKTRERERLESTARGERPEELLERFIETRAQAEDYRKHLGLLSSIRNDFDLVSQMMRSQRGRRREGKIPVPILPSIDRIVLYIDDLDRCQDKQVVQVLEAVHLLLAFDLFVVVVGVDARWLYRALKKIYPDQLGEGGADHASPADYLEKIFQIPFWLRPLDYAEQGSFAQLVDKLVGSDVEITTQPPAAAPAAADDASLSGVGDGSPSPDSVESEGDEVTTVIAPVTVTLEDETPEETLRRVKLRDTEVELMKELGPLIGKSPRATKRFINLYRLVRARKRGADLERFLNSTDDEQAQYPAVMLVLAIEVGLSPDEAGAAWRHIRALDENAGIDLPFEAGNAESDRKIEAAVEVIKRTTGLPLLREHVVPILGEISRYSFSRPT